MTKHTPGPWWPVKDSAGSWGVRTLRDEHDTLIGDRYGASICCGIGDHTEARTRGNEESNARLIAAAPDMLAELEQSLSCLRQYRAYGEAMRSIGSGFQAIDTVGRTIDSVILGIESAIAKAKGA